ncbi:hypothetical protein [Mycoplasmopsis cynos]|uniref:Integrase catalytic domain-containing protein n=1 Tax=Mycoplasmopsis cynos TaxID=171284 RepID=A0ABD8AIG1_9BACT|nr:hypothetical protein [Mycoplasmopsis cynos]MCU9935462.1 hypothetical protein [Mycoplasmopsis cynos]UWV80326.1 hypothetical protein NW069_03130 [Mycoplasmopsis cynos]UWV86545.1 hypothetical protein NW063_02430 [Mycoplasmopsis cynos]WAM05809.1 hypothetical protein OM999_00835 [Mycoplasmopsis cynos]WAM08908.1 hypothetical protein ONA03_00740 [Mycoplasmopsis cynos]
MVIKNILKTKFKNNFILHSDRGPAHSSSKYVDKIKKMKRKISMSRIRNSLDNREIEFFFNS